MQKMAKEPSSKTAPTGTSKTESKNDRERIPSSNRESLTSRTESRTESCSYRIDEVPSPPMPKLHEEIEEEKTEEKEEEEAFTKKYPSLI